MTPTAEALGSQAARLPLQERMEVVGRILDRLDQPDAALHRFPYGVIYTRHGAHVLMLAVAHQHRKQLPSLAFNRMAESLKKNPYLGMIAPNMGIKQTPAPSSTADALFPKVRQRVLAVLFGAPHRSFYTNEVIGLAQSGAGAVQRELADLAAVGLLTVRKQGNQKHFQANEASPVFAELRGLVLKTMGLADVLRDALASLAPQIEQAFVFGSVAKQRDTAASDVDLLVVSNTLGYGDVFGALDGASETLGRTINPALYTAADFRARLQGDNAFINRVMQQPKIWLIGQEESPQHAHDQPI